VNLLHGALFQYGLALLSLPIIIHLLNRRRFKKVRWAAMEFLLKAKRQNRRRMRFENLLLLLLRILLLALILAVVARPSVTGGALALLPGSTEAIERIVIVDDSASLSQKVGSRSVFERSRDALEKLCGELSDKRATDQITIIRGSRADVPDVVRQPPGAPPVRDLMARMKGWETVDMPVDLVRAVQTVVSGAASEGDDDGPSARRILYILTDLRRSDWLGPNGAKAAALAKQLRAFQEDGRSTVALIDLSPTDTDNLGIVSLKCEERVVVTEVPIRFKAEVRNFGKTAANDVQLMLHVAGSVVPAASIDAIGAGETKTVRLLHTFRDEGVVALSLKIAGGQGIKDQLERDDQRHLSVEVLRSIRVLVIDGEPSAETFEGEAAFLVRALAPPGDALSGIAVKSIQEDEILDEDLSRYHVVMCCNLEAWPSERLLALRSFVERGGGLALFLGDKVDPDAYRRDLWQKGKGLLPCPLGDKVGSGSEDKPMKLGKLSPSHPVLRVFEGQDDSMLARLRFWRAFSVPEFDPEALGEKLGKERAPKVIASYGDEAQTPFLVEKTYGQGRVLLFNTSADREWSAWPKDLSYVIVTQELVRFLAPSSASQRNLATGQLLSRAVNPARFELSAKLRLPGAKDGASKLVYPQQRDASPLQWFRYQDTAKAGIYELELKPRKGFAADLPAFVREPYAVNLPPGEGDMMRVNELRLRAAMPGVVFSIAPLRGASLLDLTEGNKKELWKSALFLFLMLLVAESVFALVAAHHRPGFSEDSADA